MWSHYAAKSSGFCIEYKFDDSHIDNQSKLAAANLLPVIYRKRPQYDKNVICLLRKLLLNTDDNNIFFYLNFLSKGLEWKSENEWRIIYDVHNKLKDKNIKMPIPTAVYLGYNISSKDEERIISIIRQKNTNQKIKLYKCTLSNSENYSFGLREIDY